MKTKKLITIVGLTISIVIVLFIGLYFAPFSAENNAYIWFSINRILGLSESNETALFKVASITHDNTGLITWSNSGLETDAYVGNITILSLSEGISMWVNDSLNLYKFPVVSEGYETFADRLSAKVLEVNATVSQDGHNQQAVPYFNLQGGVEVPKSYVYVNLDQVENLLKLNGNTSYALSISMHVQFSASFPKPAFHTNKPSIITDEKTIDLGSITITCINGQRTNAHINFPYQKFQYEIQVPYIQTIFPF